MPSFTLRGIAACVFLAVLLPALAFPAGEWSLSEECRAVTRAIGGGVAAVGGFALAMAVEKTLLQAGGTTGFKLLYLSSAGFSGVGAAYCISGMYPANISLSVLLFSGIAIVACVMWLRFYYAAAA